VSEDGNVSVVWNCLEDLEFHKGIRLDFSAISTSASNLFVEFMNKNPFHANVSNSL
jgi:hypothetical protein